MTRNDVTETIIEAGLEAMKGFGMSTDGIDRLPTSHDKAQAILLSIEGETEDESLIGFLRGI